MGGNVVLLPVSVGEFFELATFGVIMGAVSFSQCVGHTSGAILSGIAYNYFGNYSHALILYIGLYFCAMVAVFFAGKPRVYRPLKSAEQQGEHHGLEDAGFSNF